MGKCCSKPHQEEEPKEETQEVLLQEDPGGTMTGGTVIVRTPGRWGVTATTTNTSPSLKRTIITTGPPTGAGASVTKTFHFSNNGTARESITFRTEGGFAERIVTTGKSNQQGVAKGRPPNSKGKRAVSSGTAATNQGNKQAFFNIAPSVNTSRMGKTSVETTTRTYSKDGKRYEETVVVETKEDERGNVTKTTKTTTRTLDPYDTKELSSALEGSKKSRGGRKTSSSSSSDSSPERKTKSKEKKSGQASGDSLLSKLRLKKSDKSDDDSSDDEDFAETVHKAVNECRKKHGVNKLKLNKDMNKYAKEWAKKLAADGQMSHRPDNKYGENVFCLSSNSKTFKVKGDEVVDKWYSEIKDHKFGEEPKGTILKSGHFSQLVWKDTKQMGVGKARSAAGTKVFVVANFDPQGNWMGQFADQVPPVGGFAKASGGKSSIFKAKSHKSSSSSSSDSSSDEDDFVADCLKAHNNYRKKHGVPLLKISKDLNKVAKDWADTIARKDVMQHRPNGQYGENIYCAWSSNPAHQIKGSEAVDSWYSEIKDFRFGREPADLRAGHFTQVVWRDSKELGVGIARSRSGKIYVVANYNPAGNMVGSFSTKVPNLK
ncbi:uncharacterized protein LOC122245623 isoform X2 [Penaeus japonicus]|uniref:uncharacterized protein LOC122245623 isoform X2 n=1 Tax=Penaeus japonicus TaxID=27405 RepID=UPI001C70B841|nr:uncharacterized protein LOC122245623 isoform X2 [Penaeus japonicus]